MSQIESLKARSFVTGSTLAHRFPRLENWWRHQQHMTSPLDLLLRWQLQDTTVIPGIYATLEAVEDAKFHDMSSWRADMIAVEEVFIRRATAAGRRVAVGNEMPGAGVMVGINQLRPDLRRNPAQHDFLRSTPSINARQQFIGAIVLTGPGENHIAVGTTEPNGEDFIPVKTHWLGAATLHDRQMMFRV